MLMQQYETAFTRAFGRAPTRTELEQLQRVKSAFDVADNDALMLIAALFEFYKSEHRLLLQQGARLVQAVNRTERQPAPAPPQQPPDFGGWRPFTVLSGMWAASIAFVGGLALALGASLDRGYPCWVPKSATDRLAVTVLAAPTGWLVLIAAIVPALLAGTWGLTRGMDLSSDNAARWRGWAAFAVVTVALLGWFALVLVKVPHG